MIDGRGQGGEEATLAVDTLHLGMCCGTENLTPGFLAAAAMWPLDQAVVILGSFLWERGDWDVPAKSGSSSANAPLHSAKKPYLHPLFCVPPPERSRRVLSPGCLVKEVFPLLKVSCEASP